jgi:hypothetical protein
MTRPPEWIPAAITKASCLVVTLGFAVVAALPAAPAAAQNRRFTDVTSLQVVNENLDLTPGQRRVFGPFPAVPGKRTNQVNVRVGSSAMPGSTGFSYRVSVEGCD